MRLITELCGNFDDASIVSEFRVIEEAKEGGKSKLFIEGVYLQSELKNRNGRVYPKDVMLKEVNRYIKEQVEKGTAYGELGHPSGPKINEDRISHRIVSLKEDGNNFIGKAQVSSTPMGDIVRGLLTDGGSLGVSSRGLGSLKESNGVSIVQPDFRLATAADVVIDPSAPDAYVNGVMEGKEWVWDNGILVEHVIAEHKKVITKATSINLEEKMEAVFKDFLRQLR